MKHDIEMSALAQIVTLALAAIAAASATAQPLSKADSKAPYPSEYAVYEDRTQASTYLYAPLRLEFVLDSQTKRPKIGVQYFTEPGKKTLKLAMTASLRFVFDRDKLDEIAAWTRKQKGPQAKLAVMSGVSGECGPFVVVQPLQLVAGGGAKVDFTFDSTLQVSGTFEFTSRDSLAQVLRGNGTIGATCKVVHRKVSEVRQEASIPVETLLDLVKGKGWTKIDGDLESVANQFLESQSVAIPISFRPFARPAMIEWLKVVAGNPVPRAKLLGGMEWGWDLAGEGVRSRVKQYGALSLVDVEKLSYSPLRYSVAAMDDMCATASKQILDLDTGSGGCDDLK